MTKLFLPIAVLTASISSMASAQGALHRIVVQDDGTFLPKYLSIASGDTVEWAFRHRSDAIARVSPVGVGSNGELQSGFNRMDACFVRNASDPTYPNPFRRRFEGLAADQPTGPTRHGVSGIWALGPEGGAVSGIEIPSQEADRITPGITVESGCAALRHPDADVVIADDPATPEDESAVIQHHYERLDAEENAGVNTAASGQVTEIGTNIQHLLCSAITKTCDARGRHCEPIEVDMARPETIPPGTYPNGLLSSTYANPDITGVVLRFNWKDLQYDRDGTIVERWEHLDREIERAIAHGKLVTLDARAGMLGTPSWIFQDYLTPGSAYAARWCTTAPCAFAEAHPSAGQVRMLEFVDHYDEEPPGQGCGSPVRIGAPGDVHYRALYKDFIARLAAHVASDTRWFQTIAHVKLSGANLRTSEAELPHHCDDQYSNTADHHLDPKDNVNPAGDRVLDVFKSLVHDERHTSACQCNTQAWYDAGYTPAQLYDYYAELEQQIVTSFFGRKSLGYQLMQAGFPRTNAAAGGSFYGDHLYRECLVPSSEFPVEVNAGYENGNVCTTPSVDPMSQLPVVSEDLVAGSVTYCSADTRADGSFLFLTLEPLKPRSGLPSLTACPSLGPECIDTRYPGSFEQSVKVLDEAGNGRFTDPATPGHVDRVAGKLFVPQHSGIQPLPQEQFGLGFGPATPDHCAQQLAPIDAEEAGWSPTAVGPLVAGYPIGSESSVTSLDESPKGCPNEWIVDQGRKQDVHGTFPPQLTGFQTTNRVRTAALVESTLFNLTYNTNAMFIELYEDAIWRIDRTRGTGAGAITLDDPAQPVRLATDEQTCAFLVCDSTVSCYTKNLSQWSEELHKRRADAAALWASYDGLTYPALADPFPTSYRELFVNTSGASELVAYINPSWCNWKAIDLGGSGDRQPSALGLITVQP